MDLMQTLMQLDTAELSDALDAIGIEGALLGIKPISPGTKIVGPAFTVKYLAYEEKPNEFKSAGNYIDDVPVNSIVVIDNEGREDCTSWGDILTQVALMRGIQGSVINGAARDVHFIRKVNYPLFTKAIYMRSGKNRVYKADQQCELFIQGVRIRPGDILVGDDNGVVVIPVDRLHEIVEKAVNIKRTEQAIIESVASGMPLEEARKIHRYDQPWLDVYAK